jgi:hypothetical protein
MPVATVRISRPKLLLGEGNEEVRFFRALLGYLGITDVQVEQYGGKTRLKDYLAALAGPPVPGFASLTSLAVTRDADADARGAFASVCDALRNAGLPEPPDHDLPAGANPQVRVWIMPDGRNPGMLEDLCLASVQADAAGPCVDDFFRCLRTTAAGPPANLAKARVHVWLASRPEPDKRLGEAAEKGYWPWADPAFAPLTRFLRAL